MVQFADLDMDYELVHLYLHLFKAPFNQDLIDTCTGIYIIVISHIISKLLTISYQTKISEVNSSAISLQTAS